MTLGNLDLPSLLPLPDSVATGSQRSREDDKPISYWWLRQRRRASSFLFHKLSGRSQGGREASWERRHDRQSWGGPTPQEAKDQVRSGQSSPRGRDWFLSDFWGIFTYRWHFPEWLTLSWKPQKAEIGSNKWENTNLGPIPKPTCRRY